MPVGVVHWIGRICTGPTVGPDDSFPVRPYLT
jgi:hypothetical protein